MAQRAGLPAQTSRTRPANSPPAPLRTTWPNAFNTPRNVLAIAWRCEPSCARATNKSRNDCASILLTAISRNQPVRTTCAKPCASLASVLLICVRRAALAWRASRQTVARRGHAAPASESSTATQAQARLGRRGGHAGGSPRQWHQDRWHICHAKPQCLAINYTDRSQLLRNIQTNVVLRSHGFLLF